MRFQKLRRRSEPVPSDVGNDRAAASVASLLAEADQLAGQGRAIEAVDLLAEVDATRRSPELEVRLIDLRRDAARRLRTDQGRSPWPPTYADPFPEIVGELPEIGRTELSAAILGGAVAHHGALVVRGLFDSDQVTRSIEAIHEAERRRDDADRTQDDAWYRPMPDMDDMDRSLRKMVAGQGGTWLADSPAGTARILHDLTSAGAIDSITEHFGERPLFSLQKSTLRRSAPIYNFASWHQDGSFLGGEARTMNTWVALSPCGGDRPTPGIELLPTRVEEILPTDGGMGTASISDATVMAAADRAGVEPVRPEFGPGDAMLFDERFVHRTHLVPDMTEHRYALECWFFAPAYDNKKYVPLLV